MRSISLSVSLPDDLQNKIAAIKAVRALTGLGLKEAKDLVERVMPHHSEILKVGHGVLEPHFSEYVTSLKDSGLTVRVSDIHSKVRAGIADEIRKLITFTTMAGQYDISKALLDVMETYCPEPSDEFLAKMKEAAAELEED